MHRRQRPRAVHVAAAVAVLTATYRAARAVRMARARRAEEESWWSGPISIATRRSPTNAGTYVDG